jgi:hypothetical protein
MKRIFLFSLTVLSLTICNAQTNVSGFINSNTTWTVSGSPYIIVGNALLSNGFTLTINPGVVVKFNLNKALQIDGQLIAVGTNTQKIIFTSSQVNPLPGDWAKLHFSDLCTDAIFDASGNYISGTILKYCEVSYGGGLGYGAIDVQQSSPYFNHCTILNSDASGINYNCSQITIDSSSIKNCNEYGIFFQTAHYLMRDDSIIGNNLGGIHVLQQNDGIQSRILNSYFESNNYAISWQNNGNSRTTISGSSFVNNYNAVIDLLGNFDTLTCNRFINNQGGPAIYWGDNSSPISGGLIFNNLFEGNSNSSGPSVVQIGAGYPTTTNGDTLIFANNLVRNNYSPGDACCVFDSYLFNSLNLQFLRIYDNIFTNNTGSFLIKIHGDQNSNPSYDFLFMKNNTFSNPGCQYEVYNDIPYGSPNLYLNNNYWGSTSTSHIDSVIYDYFDFANQSVVYYSPILTSPVLIDSVCHQFDNITSTTTDLGKMRTNFLIYPNPFSSEAILQSDHIFYNATLTMSNCLGETVKQIKNINGQTVVISRDNLPDGLYFVRLTEGNKVYTDKIIITSN